MPVWDGRMDNALRAPPASLGHGFPADVRMCTTGPFFSSLTPEPNSHYNSHLCENRIFL